MSIPHTLYTKRVILQGEEHKKLSDALTLCVDNQWMHRLDIKQEIGRRIRAAREAKGWTLKDLAARTRGLTPSRISNWEQGTRTPGAEEVLDLANAFQDVTAAHLLCLDDQALMRISTRESHGDYVTLEPGPDLPPYHRTPVVGLAQLGTDGYYDAIEYPVGYGDGYLDVPTRDPNAYALKVRGDSMFPAIRDGWYVVIEPNRDHHPGDFVMVKTYDGRCMIKELLHERNGEIVLGNVNGNYGRLTLERDQVEKISLVGGIYPPSKYQPDGGA